MSANRLRYRLLVLLGAAFAVSVVGAALHQPAIGWVGFVFFFGAVLLYGRWRREVAAARRGSVFDREAKTDEAGTRPDQ